MWCAFYNILICRKYNIQNLALSLPLCKTISASLFLLYSQAEYVFIEQTVLKLLMISLI